MFNSAETVRIVGSTIVGLICWGIGYFHYSFFLMVIFLGLNIVKAKLYTKRQKRQTAHQLMALKEEEYVKSHLKEMPAWVNFPDTERVEWINRVIFHLWPYVGEYARKFMLSKVEPEVKANMPGPFKKFAFEEIDLGEIPARVTGIKTFTGTGRDRILMDINLVYAGDADFEVSVGAFQAGLRNIRFKGQLRVILTPLIAEPPLVGGVRVFFMDDPDIDFEFTGVGEVVEMPGLMGAIQKVINDQVREICVLPNEIAVPLISDMDITKLLFSEPDGILVMHVIEAKNLEPKDMGIGIPLTGLKRGGKSDPYIVCTVGAQVMTTKTIPSKLNPVWDEYFEAVVDSAAGQKLIVSVYDEDMDGRDEDLGFFQVDLTKIKEKKHYETWYVLEGVKSGEVHMDLRWMSLSSEQGTLEKQILPSKKIHSALLMVFVDCATNLPRIRKHVDPHPYLEMTLGSTTKKTLPRIDTRNPIFQKKFMFWVDDPDSQVLNLEAKDNETEKSLGEVSITLSNLLKEENMEMSQKTWLLTLNANVAKVVLTLRLRVLQM